MHFIKPTVLELANDLKQIRAKIIVDNANQCRSSEIFLMAYLVVNYDLRTYLQIGVGQGSSFLSMAYTMKRVSGTAYGIDVYQRKEDTMLDDEHASILIDLSDEYNNILKLQKELDCSINSEIIRKDSSFAIEHFLQNRISIDLLYLHSEQDNSKILRDLEMYFPLVKPGGFIILNNVDSDSIKSAYNKLRKSCITVFTNGRYSILLKPSSTTQMTTLEKSRLKILFSMIENAEQGPDLDKTFGKTRNERIFLGNTRFPKVSVLITSYNHEDYVSECLEGIFAQKGNFEVELIIGDDFSTDGTLKIVQDYMNFMESNKQFKATILPTDHRRGMVENLQRCLHACTGDYFAICEGDDFWIDNYKIQKQINFLEFHPECAICFNDIYFYYQETGIIKDETRPRVNIISTRDIVLDNSIGNFSRFLYDARYLDKIPDGLFKLDIADWMFNIYYSQFGDIGNVNDVMSVYRVHKGGLWSGKTDAEKVKDLYIAINEYNKFLNYEYDAEFSIYQQRLESSGLIDTKDIPRSTSREKMQHKVTKPNSWKSSWLFLKVRALLPYGSRRAKIARRLYFGFLIPLWRFAQHIRFQRDIQLIQSSNLFDKDWYLLENPDLASLDMDPALHYLLYGGEEGRDPSPNFSTSQYLSTYEDVKKAGINPLIHYLKYGLTEGREVQAGYTFSFYQHECSVCSQKIKKFVPLSQYYEENFQRHGFPYKLSDFETINPSEYLCPICSASDRDRLYALYLKRLFSTMRPEEKLKVLDIAPSAPLKTLLLEYPQIQYQSADRYMEDVDMKVDITRMDSVQSNTYDFFICSHVLEHVSDDQKAMTELYRILKPDGRGILMVPINLKIDQIEEDPSVSDIGERWQRFGQDDHIRLYSKKGFIERVEKAGFIIHQYGIDFFGEDAFAAYGITSQSILYVVEKKEEASNAISQVEKHSRSS